MRDMIYYPGFEIKDENWLKFALLYFDKLRPIIPMNCSEKVYLSDKAKRVMDETDLLQPYRPKPEEGQRASINACKEFERFLSHPERYGRYFSDQKIDIIEKWKSKDSQDCILFNEKYSDVFFKFCIDNGIATPCDEGIQISKDLSFVYMSLLANDISKQNEYEMITDNNRYNAYLINQDFITSRESEKRIKVVQNKIEVLLPADIGNIPLERFVELRKDEEFNIARRAYLLQIEKWIDCLENGKPTPMQEILSEKKEFKKIVESLMILTGIVIVSCYGFKQKEGILPLAELAVNYSTVKEAVTSIPQNFTDIREKHLARKYVSSLRTISNPAQ